jgi:hypothetical protein
MSERSGPRRASTFKKASSPRVCHKAVTSQLPSSSFSDFLKDKETKETHKRRFFHGISNVSADETFEKQRTIDLGDIIEDCVVTIHQDHDVHRLIIEVFRKTVSSEFASTLDKVAVRIWSHKELEDLSEWLVHLNLGFSLDSPSTCFDFISDVVEIKFLHCQDVCEAHIHIPGFDDRPEKKFEPLRADLRSMLEAHRSKIRSWQSLSEVLSRKADVARAEVQVAARRTGICQEKADALHDCFVQAKNSKCEGSMDEQDFRTFLMNICRVRGQVLVEEGSIRRHYGELHAQAPLRQVRFGFFLEWLVTKFPHVSDMSAWQIRRFASMPSSPWTSKYESAPCDPASL